MAMRVSRGLGRREACGALCLGLAAVAGCGGRSRAHGVYESSAEGGGDGDGAGFGATSGASGGSGATSGGFGATSGASGAGGRDCGALIDDMEDDSGRICTGNGRLGVWYAFNDGTATQWPALTTPGVPIPMSALPEPRDGSKLGVHTYGDAFNKWGAGVGLDLHFDGQTYEPYDASAYSGVTFWLRGTSSPSKISFRVSDLATTYVEWGGTNMNLDSQPAYFDITLQPVWTQYFLPFKSLALSRPPLGPAQLMNLQFLARGSSFDFWVDDIAFYAGTANCCAAGCSDPPYIADPKLSQAMASDPMSGPTCEGFCTLVNVASSDATARVTNLDGIGCDPALEQVDLAGNLISDLTPLASLPRLGQIGVNNNPVTTLVPLASAPRLRNLYVENDPLGEVDISSGFSTLAMLDLNGTGITRLSLRNLPALTQIDATQDALTSVDLELPALTYLTLDQTTGPGLSDLKLATPRLLQLEATSAGLTNLDALSGAPALAILDANQDPLVDLSGVRALDELDVLSLQNTDIDSDMLRALAGVRLNALVLTNDRMIDDATPLRDVIFGPPAHPELVNLATNDAVYLDLYGTAITDLTPLLDNSTFHDALFYLPDNPTLCADLSAIEATFLARNVAIYVTCPP
jgi:Leucine-rich repeat (LRR) protein